MPQDPLHLVCIEPSFPGRLGDVADWLVRRRGYHCRFFCHKIGPRSSWPESTGSGLDLIRFDVGGVAREPSVHWTRQLERGLCYAYGAWELLEQVRPRPIDIVLGRSDRLGSTLFAPVHMPRTPVVQLLDSFLHPTSGDLADELTPTLPDDYTRWRRSANTMDLLDLENGVHPWVPTSWQRDTFPPEYRADFRVLFDGIDPPRAPRPLRSERAIAGRRIPLSTFVVSFISRELDRLRGFDRFVSLAAGLEREGVDFLAIAVGSPVVRRSLDIPSFGRDYAAEAIASSGLSDPSRVWLLGESPPSVVAEVLSASDLHCYPSRVYPIARSLIQALAFATPVLAWDTEPLQEILILNEVALVCSSDDSDDALQLALSAARDPTSLLPLARAGAEYARQRFARDVTLPMLAEWFDTLAKGEGSRS